MFRIDSEGSTVDNLFTEGDPALGVPATVVSAEWLNEVQEEIANTVEYAGLTLTKGDDEQLRKALDELFLRGGRPTPLVQSIANNTVSADVSGFEFDSATVKAKIASFTMERSTDSSNVIETGTIMAMYNAKADAWTVKYFSLGDDAGVSFAPVVVSGTNFKLQYTSDDLTGTSYTGEIRFTQIYEIRA